MRGWQDILDELYEGSWNPDLKRFRSPYAFRGLGSANHTLTSSLVRLARVERLPQRIEHEVGMP